MGFVLLTAYTGVVGAFLYVLGCREPLAGTREQYTAARWRQTLGSTMHCVAGDGVGILVGAVLSSLLGLAGLAGDAAHARFWFVMSTALLAGFIIAYPMNWWLVANHLKHGMTIRPKKEARMAMAMGSDEMAKGGGEMAGMAMPEAGKPSPSIPIMTVLSFVALAAGLALAFAV